MLEHMKNSLLDNLFIIKNALKDFLSDKTTKTSFILYMTVVFFAFYFKAESYQNIINQNDLNEIISNTSILAHTTLSFISSLFIFQFLRFYKTEKFAKSMKDTLFTYKLIYSSMIFSILFLLTIVFISPQDFLTVGGDGLQLNLKMVEENQLNFMLKTITLISCGIILTAVSITAYCEYINEKGINLFTTIKNAIVCFFKYIIVYLFLAVSYLLISLLNEYVNELNGISKFIPILFNALISSTYTIISLRTIFIIYKKEHKEI